MKLKSYDIYQDSECRPVLKEVAEYEYDDFFLKSKELVDAIEDSMDFSSFLDEHLLCAAIDGNNNLKGVFVVNIGDEAKVEDNVKRLGIFLLLIGADGFIVCHNHPNNNSNRSGGDLFCIPKYTNLSDVIGIPFYGSYIITKDCYTDVSNNEKCYFDWKG
jgi:DNA repair protein RadC